MPSATPALKTGEIDLHIRRWVESASRWMSPDDFTFRRWSAEVDKAMQVDAYGASLLKANLAGAVGDRAGVLRWTENARRLAGGQSGHADATALSNLANLGFFSEAAGYAASALQPQGGALSGILHMGVLLGVFNALQQAYDAARAAGLDVASSPTFMNARDLSAQAAATLNDAGLSEEQLRSVLDTAGEVLREQRRFWLYDKPLLRLVRDPSPVLLYQLWVDASAQETVELNRQVIYRLVERDLDVPGLLFSFIPGSVRAGATAA